MKKSITLLFTYFIFAMNVCAQGQHQTASNPDKIDSPVNAQLSLEQIQNEIQKYNALFYDHEYDAMKQLETRTRLDSLENVELSLKSLIKRIQKELEVNGQLDHHYHIQKAGVYVRKAYGLELGCISLSVASGVCLAKGFSDNKDEMKIVGFIAGAGALACLVSSYTFHFKSGKELQLGAGKIKYSF